MPLPCIVHASESLISTIDAIGINYIVADNLDAIVRHIKTQPIAAIVIEIRNDEDTFELLDALVENPSGHTVPKLAVVYDEGELSLALEHGADDVIRAPLNPREFLHKVHTLQKLLSYMMLGSVDVLTHDFNSPLGITEYSLQLALEILDESDVAVPELHQLIRNVLRGNQRLRFTLFDMLDYFRLAGGVYDIHLNKIDLLPIVDRVVTLTSHHAHENNISVTLDTEAETFFAVADAGLIERAIIAAVDTAIKFCQPGGDILLQLHADQNVATIIVTDFGQTLEPTLEASYLFELSATSFMREKGGRSSVAMSLPFLEQAMHAMNGNVAIDFGERQTQVLLSLPI